MKLLVTGSSGLIGSEVVDYFCQQGWQFKCQPMGRLNGGWANRLESARWAQRG